MANDNSDTQIKQVEYLFMDDSLPPIKIIIKCGDLITAYENLVKITKHPSDFNLEQTF